MVQEVIGFLSPGLGAVFLETTLGGGGRSLANLEAIQPSDVLIGCDRDRDAVEICKDLVPPALVQGISRLNFLSFSVVIY
jgi:16S rRNA C1402 N4-methylase RsmH